MIGQLAATAVVHAENEHGLSRDMQLADVDRILDDERERGNANAMLVPCYGAWFGQYVVEHRVGAWVGLAEPVPPRVIVAGLPYSPFDAVDRRLQSRDAPRLADLLEQLTSCTADPTSTLHHNQRCWDALAQDARFVNRQWFPANREEATAAVDAWLRSEGLAGKSLLCLAAAGGTHAVLHAMAGANVTLVDFNAQLLEIDLAMAARCQIEIVTQCCSMDQLPAELTAQFDIVLQPVSTCYFADVAQVYAEVYRVLRPGGLYVAQHKSPVSLQTNYRTLGSSSVYELLFPQSSIQALPEMTELDTSSPREPHAIEFTHSLDAILGGLCRQGFVIEDLIEPLRGDAWAAAGTAAHRALFAPPYLKVKARKT
ncbi:MAG: class I SAM-dependent methyltransferase [Pirellulaceae bacterium]